MASSSESPAAPAARRRGPAIATPPLDTSSAAKTTKRYSYSDTPMEMQAPKFNYPITSPTNSTIDESPISSPASPGSRVLPIYTEPLTAHALVTEKEGARREQSPPPQGVHPAYFAPFREESQIQRPYKQQQQENAQHELHPPTENGTMPGVNITAPTPQSPNTPPHSLPAPPQSVNPSINTHLKPSQNTKPPEPKKPSPPAPPAPVTTIVPDSYPPPPSTTTPFSPSAMTATTTSPTSSQNHWRHNLCDPSPTCCLSLLLPCLIYGKTQYRLNRKTAGEDATNLLGYEACNGSCGLFALACGLQGVLAAIQRNRVRKAYQIEGDMATDCVKGCCCWCCVVGQDEREMKTREEERRERVAAAGTSTATKMAGGGYVSPMGGMAYAPPPKVAI